LRDLVLEYLGTAQLESLGPEFELLSERVFAHRMANKGLVPKEIFSSCLGLGGQTQVYEAVVRVLGDKGETIGFALKKRSASDSGWPGLYHNAGTVIGMLDSTHAVMQRLTAEIFQSGMEKPLDLLGKCITNQFVGRESVCWADIHETRIYEACLWKLRGDWKLFTFDELQVGNPDIIDFELAIILWANNPDREPVGDLR
jgi:hypothetical protein